MPAARQHPDRVLVTQAVSAARAGQQSATGRVDLLACGVYKSADRTPVCDRFTLTSSIFYTEHKILTKEAVSGERRQSSCNGAAPTYRP